MADRRAGDLYRLAILTPAEPYSMLFMALPLCLLFSSGLDCVIGGRSKSGRMKSFLRNDLSCLSCSMYSHGCLLEATAPKPGNVHRGADFEDLTYVDFLLAAQPSVRSWPQPMNVHWAGLDPGRGTCHARCDRNQREPGHHLALGSAGQGSSRSTMAVWFT